MGTPIDDISVGDYLVITHINGEFLNRKDNQIVSGEPLKLLALGLPFLAVLRCDGHRASIDTRVVTVQKVPEEYGRAIRQRKRKVKKRRTKSSQSIDSTRVQWDKEVLSPAPISTGNLVSSVRPTMALIKCPQCSSNDLLLVSGKYHCKDCHNQFLTDGVSSK